MIKRHTITWVTKGRKAKCEPDPNFPKGRPLDASNGDLSCKVDIPYPAPECGMYIIKCEQCGMSVGITAAGRPDDPISLQMPCKLGETNDFPRGKMNDSDEGGINIAIFEQDKTVIIDFGKELSWLGLDADTAEQLGNQLIKNANSIRMVQK